jgi:hypothetical protein
MRPRARLRGPSGDQVSVEDVVGEAPDHEVLPSEGDTDEVSTEILGLTEALEQADDLPLDERLELLRRTEATIARALEGLDGL